ncbi:hypothetical protein QRE63_32310 (plasmid) [Bacillus mycoides]|uniref:hypothetical protein n=1 Tax=Bacillus mycoides TaxID=1405 RepID=UPI000DC2E676|nr:hypothetical protein [Bacillus cereus]RAN67478.1 hypothetical protein B5P40_24970 [Bacillus sp. SRB_8]WJE67684.1 hypothetical protein QRE63_32310 [Bacillus mycoides]
MLGYKIQKRNTICDKEGFLSCYLQAVILSPQKSVKIKKLGRSITAHKSLIGGRNNQQGMKEPHREFLLYTGNFMRDVSHNMNAYITLQYRI